MAAKNVSSNHLRHSNRIAHHGILVAATGSPHVAAHFRRFGLSRLVPSPLYDVMNASAVADPFDTAAYYVAAFTYDCVIGLAIAFSRSADVSNGAEVAARFREARFEGATGQVEFDSLGDRDASTINCTSPMVAPVAPCQKAMANIGT
jgi:hypothetical protein